MKMASNSVTREQYSTDIGKIRTDIAIIKQDIDYIKCSINKIEKCMNGNGHDGILSRLDKLEGFKDRAIGILLALNVVWGIIIFVINKFW
jgi:hypothetical protein